MSGTGAGDCVQIIENLSRFLEREMPEDERITIEEHVAGCAGCRQFLETFRETLRMCRQAGRPDGDSDCLKRAADAARAVLARRGLL